jgi:hypothetical protein
MPDLEWNAFTIRLSFFAAGLCLGLLLGWTARAARFARNAADEAHEAAREAHEMRKHRHDDEAGATRIESIALGIVVVLTAISAIVAGVGYQAATEALDRQEVQATCTARILTRTVDALNERNRYSDQVTERSNDVLSEQIEFLRVVLQPTPDDVGEAALRDYLRAIEETRRTNELAARQRRENPYPTTEQIAVCRGRED